MLWRLERNGEVRSAVVYTHPHGYDLRAMVGAALLHSQVLRDSGCTPATICVQPGAPRVLRLRETLTAKRWT